MRGFLLFISLMSLNVFGSNPTSLQYSGVQVTHQHSSVSESILIERAHGKECMDVHINPETIYGGNLAAQEVPATCKKTFVTTVGKIQPMSIAKGILTVGEIEVLDFIKNRLMKEPNKYVLVDSRRPNWFEVSTIPGAVNIPYDEMSYDKDFEEDFARMLKHLNIKKVGDKFDFSEVKTALLFCNASWCGQSPQAIKILLAMGYPKEKLLWFRGGLQDWVLSGFNVVKPK